MIFLISVRTKLKIKNNFEDDDGCPDAKRDLDGDGIYDPSDRCPQQAEDRDNFADQDGCPDEDNDLDQIQIRKTSVPTKLKIMMGSKIKMAVLTRIMMEMEYLTTKIVAR